MTRRVGIPGRADGRVLTTGGVTRSGSTTDGHLAVWNGSSADSIKDGGAVGGGGIASTRTAYGSRGSGSTTGDLWYATDGPLEARWNGSTWDLRAMGFPAIDPNGATWGWINQGTATVDASKGFIFLTDPTGTGLNFRIRQEGYTSSSSITRTALIVPNMFLTTNFSGMGIGFRDSVSGRLSCIGPLLDGSGINCIHAASATSDYVSAVSTLNITVRYNHIWLQIQKDASNLYFRTSFDGQNFYQVRSEGKNSYLTNDPDNVFFYIMGDSNMGANFGVSLMSWG